MVWLTLTSRGLAGPYASVAILGKAGPAMYIIIAFMVRDYTPVKKLLADTVSRQPLPHCLLSW